MFGTLVRMQYTQTGDTYICKIEQGEEVVSVLTDFCVTQGIENAHFTGIGAVKKLTCGYYALDEKKYYFTDYAQLLEVVSLTGNIALKDGEPFVHMHGVFTGEDNNAFGGHIKEMTVGVVLEVFLKKYETSIERHLDEGIGLYLMKCGQ